MNEPSGAYEVSDLSVPPADITDSDDTRERLHEVFIERVQGRQTISLRPDDRVFHAGSKSDGQYGVWHTFVILRPQEAS